MAHQMWQNSELQTTWLMDQRMKHAWTSIFWIIGIRPNSFAKTKEGETSRFACISGVLLVAIDWNESDCRAADFWKNNVKPSHRGMICGPLKPEDGVGES